ncbi:MAG: APC family permease [Verrucomicrobia bacterium]|mgnify:CR=1 FL=1|jgi:basic amino acid/polyamine antiporter, APA family|nr:APC family permease [Verrucomicrobiota bacterium]
MSDTDQQRRKVGLAGATALVVANMIGVGIFTTTGFLLADMPSRGWVLFAWLVGGIMALLGAACYGALAQRLPESGGEYFFLSKTIHPSVGYISGWLSLFVGFSAPIAAAAYGVGVYAQPWLFGVEARWTGTFAILMIAFIHGGGVRKGLLLQNLMVGLKLIFLAIFLSWSGFQIEKQPPMPVSEFQFSTFTVSLVWIFFAYSGWNAVVYIAGEVKKPQRNLPRSMLYGTSIVIAFYLALNGVFLWSTPPDAISGKENVASIVAESLGGANLAAFVSLMIVVSLITSISAMLMAGPRVYAKMADDGYLPTWMKSPNPPGWENMVFQVVVVFLLLWIPRFQDLLTYIGFTLGIGTALTVIGLIRLKIKEGRNIHVIGWPLTPVLFLAMVLWVTAFSIWNKPLPSAYGLLTLGLGWFAWWFQEKGKSKRGFSEPKIGKP